MGWDKPKRTYDTSNGFGNPDDWRKAFKKRMSNEEANTIINAQKDTPWTILGIVAGSSLDEIKKAFKTLIMIWHPDKNDNSEESNEKSKQIIAAYTVLTGK